LADIRIEKVDEVNCRVICDNGIAQEISEYFTFDVPGAKFSPQYKNGMWDGKIRLFGAMTRVLYIGLAPYLEKFAESRGYTVHCEKDIVICNDVRESDVDAFITNLQLPPEIEVREYQFRALMESIVTQRKLLVSPTASGKSLIIYMIIKWFGKDDVLIVVPTVGLVKQMRGDFIEYGMDENEIQIVMAGETKRITKRVTITTWQSAFDLPKSWFSKYRVMIGDEAHQFKAKSLTKMMANLTACPVKIGTTGTLDGLKVNKLVLEGMFGPVVNVETTSNLMEAGHVAELSIKCIVFDYPEAERKHVAKLKEYKEEINFIVTNPRRNEFIANLALATKGNTLVLFNFVEKHGIPLFDLLKKKSVGRNIYFVSGKTVADEREFIRTIVEKEDDAIIVASYGTFSTGINIKRLHNAIAAHPTKSTIRLLQSIGRILRMGEGKETAKWFDLSDDLAWKSWVNHTLKHFSDRLNIYVAQKFKYTITKVKI
jgi:superfamily II DNA or RNA helicase